MRRRRRPTLDASPSASDGLLAGIRRGSSSFSDYSINEAAKGFGASADDLFNPRSTESQLNNRDASHYLPLVFALLPALAGVFFQNGAPFFTDLILLSLAAVVLHWSVTQPWDWYLETQQVRVANDGVMSSPVLETDSELESSTSPSPTPASEEPGHDIEDTVGKGKEKEKPERVGRDKEPVRSRSTGPQRKANRQWEARRAAAEKELRMHEILALAWCFAFPVLSSYLLHTIRGQLSRPSEGLVSDYNLTIFLCAAELRPVSHLIRMIRNRTLRMQRVVSANPHRESGRTAELDALASRLDHLEARTATTLPGDLLGAPGPRPPPGEDQAAAVARQISGTVQPELDALNRAVRRYEKKLALLASQTDARLEHLDRRVQDTVALAAIAARNSRPRRKGILGLDPGLFARLAEATVALAMLPVHTAVAVFTFPVRAASTLLRGGSSSGGGGGKHLPPEKAARRSSRDRATATATAVQGRDIPDRIPNRLSRR